MSKYPNANDFVPAMFQSNKPIPKPVLETNLFGIYQMSPPKEEDDEMHQIFMDGVKRHCLTDHMAASKHWIVKNRSYIVFDMSKHVLKDVRSVINEFEIGKISH